MMIRNNRSVRVEPVWEIEANLWNYLRAFGSIPGSERCEGAVSWVFSGCPILNWVFDARLPNEAEASRHIRDVVGRWSNWQQPVFWLTGPQTTPECLPELLAQHGFVHQETWTRMLWTESLTTEPSHRPELQIREVTSLAELETWCEIYVADITRQYPRLIGNTFFKVFSHIGLGPHLPWRHFLAYVDRKPVATMGSFRAQGVVGLHWGKTLPEARGRGIATALAREVVRQVVTSHDSLIVIASDEARGLFERLGAKPAAPADIGFHVWRPPHTATPPGATTSIP